ncbi:MAG: hypothetical protein BAA01_05995 [Bacillus thermozeamaize]|uniref:Tripartite ATP-independent periplasmic transporters DctQ component domain-containing protein n=1 Tax=Bacillus thermozeamaize TaxID=230954 RepID=A0A1Y3PF51_9BACI|nr:MAG: hypothetical protein BAA01_05995 [Bacillus thermozeamaize]
MQAFLNVVRRITDVTRWLALATMAFMMFFITIAVIGRAFHVPVLGDVEVVQLSMVILIMFGLAYSQSRDAHVSIGLLVDRFPPRMQALMDVIGYTLTFIACLVIGWVYLHVAIRYTTEVPQYTDLLEIPLTPFKYIVMIGFFLWGLEALLKVIQSLVHLLKGSVEGGGE